MRPALVGFVVEQLKLMRRSLRRGRATLLHGGLGKSPVLFANAFPKSGTHLLIQVLQGMSRIGPVVDSGLPAIVMYDGPTGQPRSLARIQRQLARLRPGDIAYGHLHAVANILETLTQEGFATFFIFRDPRDVVVSHVHYVTEMEPDHVHHRYYAQQLKTFDERLAVSIRGRQDALVPFPDIRRRFEPYLGWLDCPQVLAIRFEDFVNQRSVTLERILTFVQERGFRMMVPKGEALLRLAAAIHPEKSPTFRSGTVGKWRETFTEKHKALFKEVAGDLLIRLGYEGDHDW